MTVLSWLWLLSCAPSQLPPRHGALAFEAVDAFEARDLERLRRRGEALAAEAWGTDELQAAGRLLAHADDTRAACVALGRLAAACGACHDAHHTAPAAPPGRSQVSELWRALALRDDGRWRSAAKGRSFLHVEDWPGRAAALPRYLWATAGEGRASWRAVGLDRHMRSHLGAATDAAWFVARGQLDQVRRRAAQLQHEAHPALPEVLQPFVPPMVEAASALASAQTIPEAAAATTTLARRCASCHEGASASVAVRTDDIQRLQLDPDGDHGMAPYLLWTSLLVGSDLAWREGARALALPPRRPGTEALRARYGELVTRARSATGEARGDLWTELLATCAPCHDAGGVSLDDATL
ncbi:MAG: hypothetical protein KTR31_30445 [Myxococcales bacterium]|nr:hypothetical protein [Myxococcales bacterium]